MSEVLAPWKAPDAPPSRPERQPPQELATPRLQFPALTGFRFFLALWVICHHLAGRGMMLESLSQILPPSAWNLVRGGYLAVGTFFMLSGFVLARGYGSALWNKASLYRYGISRFARVYPVYLLSLAVMLPFVFEANLPASVGKTSQIANYTFLLQGWIPPVAQWNTPAWSLSCEIFFYLCFPLIAALLSGLNWQWAATISLAVCFLPTGLKMIGVPATWKALMFLADFVIGMLAARLFTHLMAVRRPLFGYGHWFYLPGLVGGAALVAYPEIIPNWVTMNTALRPLNAMILLGLAFGGGALASGLSSARAVYLGKVSYAMYILHIPILWWFRRFELPIHWVPKTILFVALVIVISSKVFKHVEEPANHYLRHRLLGS